MDTMFINFQWIIWKFLPISLGTIETIVDTTYYHIDILN